MYMSRFRGSSSPTNFRYCPHQKTWSLLARGWRGKLVRGEVQRTQLQPLSLRVKNIVCYLAGMQFRLSNEANSSVKNFNKVIHSKHRDIISRLIDLCDEDRQCTRTTNKVDVFGTGITRDDVSQAAAGPCRLQLCPVLGSSVSSYLNISVDSDSEFGLFSTVDSRLLPVV
jgi:hypothetical protein